MSVIARRSLSARRSRSSVAGCAARRYRKPGRCSKMTFGAEGFDLSHLAALSPGCPCRFWQAEVVRAMQKEPCHSGGIPMPTLPLESHDAAERLTLEQAIACVTQRRHVALSAPEGTVLTAVGRIRRTAGNDLPVAAFARMRGNSGLPVAAFARMRGTAAPHSGECGYGEDREGHRQRAVVASPCVVIISSVRWKGKSRVSCGGGPGSPSQAEPTERLRSPFTVRPHTIILARKRPRCAPAVLTASESPSRSPRRGRHDMQSRSSPGGCLSALCGLPRPLAFSEVALPFGLLLRGELLLPLAYRCRQLLESARAFPARGARRLPQPGRTASPQ